MTLFERSLRLAHWVSPEGGTLLEFGVFEGVTFQLTAGYAANEGWPVKMIGFDSWKGLPAEADGVWRPDRHAVGELQIDKPKCLVDLCDHNPNIRLVDGFLEDTLTLDLQQSIADLVWVNVDVDLYSSTTTLLEFIGPLLRPGTVIYFDDWKDPKDNHDDPWGEHRAWEEWYGRNTRVRAEVVEQNAVNQRTMIITRVGDERYPHGTLAELRFKMLFMEP